MPQKNAQIHTRRSSSAIWMIVVLLAIIATCLLMQTAESVATARETTTGAASNDSVLTVAGQLDRNSYGLYLVDTAQKTVCVYKWLSNADTLRLMAARNYTYDRQLDEYKTKPSPHEIRELVRQAKRLDEASAK